MRIAFVGLPGMLVGGIPSYVYRVAQGMQQIGYPLEMLFTTQKMSGSVKAYQAAGMDDLYFASAKVDEFADHVNRNYDWVIFEQAGAYGDFGYAKTHDNNTMPRYYKAIERLDGRKVKVAAFLHCKDTYGKHSPYFDFWENVCDLFLCNKPLLVDAYKRDKGKVPAVCIPVPISTRVRCNEYKKNFTIATTQRISFEKRHVHILRALQEVDYYRMDWYSGMNEYFPLQNFYENLPRKGNVVLHNETKTLDLDTIFRDSALVYNSTKLAEDNSGGVENVILEGAIRGCVPLITKENTERYPGGIPMDSCYAFEIYTEKGDSNLVQVLRNVNVESMDYKTRQRNVINFIHLNKSDVVIAKKLEEALNGF